MEFLAIILVAAATFGLCFCVDKGFTKLFRSKKQHQSGLSVRLSKRYGSFGLIFFVFGLAALFTGLNSVSWLLIAGGILIAVLGIGLVVYYMTFGVYYDADGFILTTFGKKSTLYPYKSIQSQQLFNSYGNIIIELDMEDGRSVQLQSGMTGVYPFLDKAFAGWCRQKNLNEEDCPFYNPDNSCWFPPREVK